MKPELSSIPSSSCIPKGMPAAQVSKDTPGTHILTKHSSRRTAAGILQCPSIQPDHRFTSSVPGLHTFQTVALLLLFILVLQNPHQNFPSLLFQYPLFSLCTFLLYRPADQTLASAAFSIPPEVRERVKQHPLKSQKETEAPNLAEEQTPCCTCARSGRSVFS